MILSILVVPPLVAFIVVAVLMMRSSNGRRIPARSLRKRSWVPERRDELRTRLPGKFFLLALLGRVRRSWEFLHGHRLRER